MEINEVAHAFPGLYQWSDKAARKAYDAIMNGEEQARVDFDRNMSDTSHISSLTIHLKEYDYESDLFSGQFDSVNNNGIAVIDLFYNPAHMISYAEAKEHTITNIATTISHELTHAIVFALQRTKGRFLNPKKAYPGHENEELYSIDYRRAIYYTNKINKKVYPNAYEFFWGLYLSDYHEIQAYSAEAHAEVTALSKSMENNPEQRDTGQFLTLIVNTRVFKDYNSTLNSINHIMDSESSLVKLQRELEANFVTCNLNELKSKCKSIRKHLRSALQKITNNAYIHNTNHLSEGRLLSVAREYSRQILSEMFNPPYNTNKD